MKVYCVDHKVMCCVICLAANHRKCDNVKTFDEMAENMKKNEAVQELMNKISNISCTTETLLGKKKENINNIERQYIDILSEMSKVVEEAKAKLDDLNYKFKEQFSLKQKENTMELVSTKERLENFQKFLSYCEKTLETASKFGSPKQTFVALEKVKRHIDIQGKELEQFLKDEQDISYKLVLDKHFTALNTSMSSIAEVQLQNTPHHELLVFTTEDTSDGVKYLQRQLRSAGISELETVKLWDVQTAGRITGGLFLDDGNLICVDHDMNNLYVFGSSGKLLSAHPLVFKPWGVSQCPDGRLFVSEINGTNGISVFAATNFYPNKEKYITTKYNARAVHITERMVLMQLDTGPEESIHLMTLDGLDDREVCTCSQNSGIAVSTSGGESRFYHCQNKAVICRSLDGKEVFRHTLWDLDSPRGVALDAADNVYVCGMNSDEIFVISKDGLSSRVLMSECSKPHAISFNKTGTKFFVSFVGNKTVSMYDLLVLKSN